MNLGDMLMSNRKCVKKMRLELFQIHTTDIKENFKKRFGSSMFTDLQKVEVMNMVHARYKDEYFVLIAKACIFDELEKEEYERLLYLQSIRSLDNCKMYLPEVKIKEKRRMII